MQLLKNISIATKIIAISTFLAAIFLGSSFTYVAMETKQELEEKALLELKVDVEHEKDKIELHTEGIRNTIITLSETPPFQGIIRARKNDGYDEKETSSLEQWNSRLSAMFQSEMDTTGYYDQLRYIDETGQEIVRVDYINNKASKIPENRLQNKKDRDYFMEASVLDSKQTYVSTTDLNREGSPPMISVPYRPVIRYAVPIFDEINGQRKGILIANVLVEKIIVKNLLKSNITDQIFITDEEGFFIIHPDEKKEWGHKKDLNTGISLYTEFNNINQKDLDLESGYFIKNDNVFVFAKVYPHSVKKGRGWIILENVSKANIFTHIDKVVQNASIIAFVSFFILFFVFLFFIKHLLSPLKELTVLAEEIGRGNFEKKVNVKSNDEIGKLAMILNSTTVQMKALYGNLEKKIKKRTQELNDEKEKLNTILYSIGDGVFVVDNDSNLVFANRKAIEMSEYTKKEIDNAVGKKYSDYFKFISEKDESEKNILKIRKQNKKSEHILFISKNGDKIHVSNNVETLKDEDGNTIGTVIVFRDVTDEHEIDKAKTELISLASHQLRTPLSAMRWNTEMLLDGELGRLKKEQKEVLQDIYDSNKVMISLIGSLLNVSRIDLGTFAIDPEPTDFKVVAESVAKELSAQIKEKKQSFKKKIDKLPKISVDPQLLRIIFQNILSNAVKYTPEKGKINLEVVKDKNNVLIKLTDTGFGIPKNQSKKIFLKLFRADNVVSKSTEGTGLGLYIVKAIIDESGGKIWFESEEGKGTTFFITIPLKGMKKKEGNRGLS